MDCNYLEKASRNRAARRKDMAKNDMPTKVKLKYNRADRRKNKRLYYIEEF